MEKNVVEQIVVPEVPKVIPNEQVYVYVPLATFDTKGVASYDNTYFTVTNGHVSIKDGVFASQSGLQEANDKIAKNTEDIERIDGDYVKKTILAYRVYGTNNRGERAEYDIDALGTMRNGAISRRTSNAGLIVPTRSINSNTSVVNKEFADGMRVGVTLDDEYKLTVTLYNKDGLMLGTPQVVDFPVESMIVDIDFDEATKSLVLTLQNGNSISVPVGDIINGLISSTEKGQPNGVATLGADGKVPSEQLPEFETDKYLAKNDQGRYIFGANEKIRSDIDADGRYVMMDVDGFFSAKWGGVRSALFNHDGIVFDYSLVRYKMLFPQNKIDDQTFAMLSDIDPLKTQLELHNQVLLQSGIMYSMDNTATWTERLTAGANVLDGSKAVLKKVVGSTVACRNLLNPDLLSGGSFVTFNGKSCYLFKDVGDGFSFITDFLPNTQYTISLQIYRDNNVDAATVFVVHYTDGTTSTDWNAREEGIITTTAGKTVERITSWSGYGKNCYIDLETAQINEGTALLPYQPYFTGLKSTSFAGIKSKNADGTETSTLAFPKTDTPLGVTIDFENKKITDYGVDFVLTGTEDCEYYDYKKFQSVTIGSFCPAGNKTVADYVSTDSEKTTGNEFTTGTMWCGYASSRQFMWLGILAKLGYLEAGTTPTTEEANEAIEKFKAWLAERYASGNPVTVRYLARDLQSETDFTESNEYTAYKGGTEKVLDNDGTEYGVDNTMTVNYILVSEVNGQ